MYPHYILSLFPAFPRDDKVFVAMSFDARFEGRWKNVLEPAIRSCTVDGRHLEPLRVDTRRVSDSILTEIVTAIANARIILADVTSLHTLNGHVCRNTNVFYEVGIAHAARLPEEVLLFRSDHESITFDIANIRVNSYDPDDKAAEAQRLVAEAISSALREIDLSRSLTIKRTVDSLDAEAYEVLEHTHLHIMKHPDMGTVGYFASNAPHLLALNRLLDMGLVRVAFPAYSEEEIKRGSLLIKDKKQQFTYQLTDFGKAVLPEARRRLSISSVQITTTLHDVKK
jgi:hypothetical protein